MGKKRYNVFLEEEGVEFVRPFLEKRGMSFSGFLNQAVEEYARALKTMDLPEKVEDMKLGDLLEAFKRMVKGMKE